MDRVRTLCLNLHNIAKLDGGFHTVVEEGDALYQGFLDILVAEDLAQGGRSAENYREMKDLSERLSHPSQPLVDFEVQLFHRLDQRVRADMKRF